MVARSNISEINILEQLDKHVAGFDFPILDNWHWRIGKTRMTAFLNSDEWLIVFEVIVFDVKSYTFENMVYGYGNKISKPGFQTAMDVIEEPPGKPLDDDDGNTLIDLLNFSVIINGEERHFLVTEQDYIRAGILPHLHMEIEAKLLRLLCFILPKDAFLLPNTQILALLKRPKLNEFVQVDKWSHPDVAQGELPSQNSCMKNLAKALAQHNKNLYNCPEEKNKYPLE